MTHGHEGSTARAPITGELAQRVAQTMQALATPSRVLILSRLRDRPHSVNELADAVAMEASAVSHQLRLLRHLGLVVGHREGRRVHYALHDSHVAVLLDEAVGHVEHVRLDEATARAGSASQLGETDRQDDRPQ